jgi:hypothetical protein
MRKHALDLRNAAGVPKPKMQGQREIVRRNRQLVGIGDGLDNQRRQNPWPSVVAIQARGANDWSSRACHEDSSSPTALSSPSRCGMIWDGSRAARQIG